MQRRTASRPWNALVNVVASSELLTESQRVWTYLRGGIDLNGTSIRPGCWFFSDRVTFGHDGMINRGCSFESRELISLGARVFLGPEVFLGTSSHEVGPSWNRAGTYRGGAISVGDGVWLGARSVVLPDVAIGDGCVIAAGSVVTESTEPNWLYAGVPARRKKQLG